MTGYHQFRRIQIFTILSLLLVVLPPINTTSAAFDAQLVKINSSEVNEIVWVAYTMGQLSESDKDEVETIFFMHVLEEMYKLDPSMPKDEALAGLNQLRDEYHKETNRRATLGLLRSTKLNTTSSDVILTLQVSEKERRQAYIDHFMDVMDATTVVAGLFPAAPVSVPLIIASQAAKYTVKYFGNELLDLVLPKVDEPPQVSQNDASPSVNDFRERTLQDLYEEAQKNQNSTNAINEEFAPQIGSRVTDSAKSIIINNTTVNNNLDPGLRQKVENLIQANGSISSDLTSLKEMSSKEFQHINDLVTSDTMLLADIDKNVSAINKNLAKAAADKKTAESHELLIKGSQSAVYLLSTFIGFADKTLGKRINVVGNAAIQMADSINKLAQTADTIAEKGFSLATGLASAVATSNFVGAALSIFSLFSGSGPSPEQMILDEIDKLRDDVQALRTEMNSRFDRIEQQLNAIYKDLADRLNDLSNELHQVHRDVVEIQVQLGEIAAKLDDLQSRVNVIDQNTDRLLKAEFQKELFQALEYTIPYKLQHAPTDEIPYGPGQGSFQFYAKIYYNWATRNARTLGAYGSGPAGDFSDQSLYSELDGSHSLYENINYLARYIKRKSESESWGVPTFYDHDLHAGKDLPHPGIWATSAGAYAKLLVEWPDWAGRYNFSLDIDGSSQVGLEGIAQVGDQLQTALQRITLTDKGAANTGLFDHLITNYNNKYNMLETVITRLENEHLDQLKSLNTNASEHLLDLWGGADQPTEYYTLDKVQLAYNCTGDKLPAPRNMLSMIPRPWVLADYLTLDSLQWCVDAVWVDTRTEPVPAVTNLASSIQIPRVSDLPILDCPQSDPDCRRHNQPTYGKLQVRISAQLKVHGSTIPLVYSLTDDQEQLTNCSACPGIMNLVTQNWTRGTNWKARFERNILQVPFSESQVLNVRTLVNARLVKEQQNLYNDIAGNIRDTARDLSGAKRLLNAVITLGMPRAMASDDALRSLLYGSQGVIDGIGIQYLYTQAGTDLNDSAVIDAYKAANIANSRNLHDVLPSLTGQRAAALRQILIQHLQLIAQNEETESDPLVDLTLKLLRTIKTQVQPRSFPQTGQSLYGTFEDYWDHGGGLVVFGYPKTEADVIPNIDTGRSYLTQWFERNRMEQHLEFAGSPYFVELGQLGKERMLQLNMNPAAVPREPGPQDGCHWFEATGHNVCNQDGEKGFKSYWEQNGVKDPLLPNPYVQSLALFGLPLTDAHMETNSSCVSVLTQWFERARFEWLPNNQDPYKVELGLLGNEIHENLPPCHQ